MLAMSMFLTGLTIGIMIARQYACHRAYLRGHEDGYCRGVAELARKAARYREDVWESCNTI